MIVNGLELQKKLFDLGYFDKDYCMDLDPTITYQEFLLIMFLRYGDMHNDAFDPDKAIAQLKEIDGMKDYEELWLNEWEGSKHNPMIIDKDWEVVPQNKKGIKLNKNERR